MSKLGLAAGRPTASSKKIDMSDDKEFVRVNAEVTEAEREKLKIYCAKHKLSITQFIRNAIASLPNE